MAKRLIFIAVLFSLLAGCASTRSVNAKNSMDSVEKVQELKADRSSVVGKDLTAIRSEALKETALSVGAQAALAYRSKQINAMLDKHATYLDYVFNFNLLLMDHNVLPPVLVEGDNSLNLDDPTTIRIADRTYQIVSQAHFVTTPPTWRNYLWLTYTKPQVPDNSLLPENSKERSIWKKYVAEGWQQGIVQADDMYKQNLATLKRDYTGMVRYKFLLTQHMINAPFVTRTDLGVTGGGSDMRVNDQVLRITQLPSLQPNSQLWNPVISPSTQPTQ